MHTNYSVSLSTKCLKKPSIAHQYAALLTLLNRNLGILRMRNTISKLHKFSDYMEQYYLYLFPDNLCLSC